MFNIIARAAIVTLVLSPVFLGFYYVQWGGQDFSKLVFFFILIGLIPAVVFISMASILVFYIEGLKKIFLHKIFVSTLIGLITLAFFFPLEELWRNSKWNDTMFFFFSAGFGLLAVSLTIIVQRHFDKN